MKRKVGCGAIVVVLVFTLAALLIIPMLIPTTPMTGLYPPETLADPDSQFVEINGTRVHLKTRGEGEPVFVLMHGFASSQYTWQAVMEELSQYGRVIAYDRTGFGLSERPTTWEGQNPYGPEAQVDLLTGLLDYYGVEKAILVGNSAGGTVAMQAALAHPERVSALILADPAVYNGGGPPGWIKPLLGTGPMRRLGPVVVRQMLNRSRQLLKMAWHNPALLSDEMIGYYQKPFQVENWDKALWEFTLASQPPGLAEHLEELTLPVLVITGDDDRIVPPSDSIRLAGELPNADLEVINESGHVPQEEQPRAFMQVVNRFLDKIQPEE